MKRLAYHFATVIVCAGLVVAAAAWLFLGDGE